MGKLYNNAITTTAGFKYTAEQPLDDRDIVERFEDLATLVNDHAAYEGMRVYVTADQKSYELKNDGWEAIASETFVEDKLNDKVDKVTGKGLSTNDYTTTEKNKLAGIAAGAEKNVQPDWEQSDSTKDDFIKNKTHYRTVGSTVISTIGVTYDDWDGEVNDNNIYADIDWGTAYGTKLSPEVITLAKVDVDPILLNSDVSSFNIESFSNDGNINREVSSDYTLIYLSDDFNADECDEHAIKGDIAILALKECNITIDFHSYNPARIVDGDVNIHIPSPGLWITHNTEINNVTFGTYEYHTLDENYIPDTIARVTDIPEVTHGTFLDFEPYYIFDGREFNFTSDTITIYPEDPENSYGEATASVVWDGVLYDALPLTVPDSGHVYSGEGFGINFDNTDRPDGTYGTVIYVYSETLGVHTIKLYNPSKKIETVKQLDEKYIPDTIAKVVDIKNGTYFTEAEKYDILVDTTTINVEAEDFYYRTTQSPFTAQIIDGNKYLVIFDEVSYICYGRKYNKINDTLSNCFDYCLIGDVVFNKGNYSRPISGSNLPFCIVNDYFENTNDFTADVLVFGDTASTHTIKIVDVTPTVKKLPEEFLADNFKAVTKGFGEKSAIFGLGQEASGAVSIAAGQSTVASGWMSIALGLASKASGAAALTLGQLAEASGTLAVAHGFNTKASGAAAVAAGDGTIAGSECQLVHGKFNIEDTADTYAHIVGGGENNMNRKNIYALDWTGNASFAGQVAASSIKIGNTTFTEAQLTKILKFIESIEEVNN